MRAAMRITGNVYIEGIHRYSFRPGERAKILGLKWVQPHDGAHDRVCIEHEYYDGLRDYIPLSEIENGNYALSHWSV